MDEKAYRRLYDLTIGGGGCAALWLAWQLMRLGYKGRVAIIEQRDRYHNDRTWAFWWPRNKAFPLPEIIKKRWSAWSLAAGQKDQRVSCPDYDYCMVPAGDFYQHILSNLKQAGNFDLITGCTISSIKKVDSRSDYVITTSNGAIPSKQYIEARPIALPQLKKGESLWQQFTGFHVRSQNDFFDSSCVKLMHFLPGQKDIRFLYVLPISAREALIEPTILAPQKLDQTSVESFAREILLAEMAGGPFEIIEKEGGCLPMALPPKQPHLISLSSTWAARPSSGYAFLSLLKASQRLAQDIYKGKALKPLRYYSEGTVKLDRIMLRFLNDHSDLAPELFYQMFERLPAATLVRFLSAEHSRSDILTILSSMPFRLRLIETASALNISLLID